MDTTAVLGIAGTTLAGYFAIMNPVASTPVFIALTEQDDAATKRSVAVRSLAVTFGIVVVVSVAGNLIFKLFGVSLATLRITGGIVLFIIGYRMLQGASSHAHKPSDADVAENKEAQLSVAMSPLGIAMLAVPGTIATAMIFAADGWLHIAISLASFTVILWGDVLLLSLLRSAGGVPRAEWPQCGDAFDGVDRGLNRGEHVAQRSWLSRSGRRLICIGLDTMMKKQSQCKIWQAGKERRILKRSHL